MTDETTLPQTEMNVEPDQAIADLLTGGEEIEEAVIEESTEDTEVSEEENTEESTEEDESNEEAEDETPETWADALGVEDTSLLLDDEGNFAGVNIKVDGESSTVNMKDLIAGFQTSKHNTNTSQKLADDRRQFDTVRNNAVADYTKKLDDVSKLSEHMNNSLMGDYNNVDWQALRQSDPAEYAAAYQDFERRKQDIQRIHSAIDSERTKEQSVASTQNQQATQQYLQAELTKVQANNPEWDTTEKLQTAFKDMSGFVEETYGITPDVFNSMGDSRYVQVIQDAMAYRKGKSATQSKRKQNLPKFQKSKSGVKVKKASKLDKLTKAARSAEGGAGKRQLQDSAIAELLTGG